MDAQTTIQKLDAKLAEAEQVIEALRAQQLDAVVDDSGATLVNYKSLATELAESEQRFYVLLQNFPVAAYTYDADGRITYFNEQAVKLWGREPKLNDPTDRFCGSFRICAQDGSPLDHRQTPMALALSENKVVHECEGVIERPDGSRRVVLAHASPVHDDAANLKPDEIVGKTLYEYFRTDDPNFEPHFPSASAKMDASR